MYILHLCLCMCVCCSLRRSAIASTKILHHRVSISDLFLGPRYAKERELPGPGISRCASWLSGCGEVKYMRLNMGTIQIWPFQILLMGRSMVMMINHGRCFNDLMVFPRFFDKSISCLKSFGRLYPQIFRNWTCHHQPWPWKCQQEMLGMATGGLQQNMASSEPVVDPSVNLWVCQLVQT